MTSASGSGSVSSKENPGWKHEFCPDANNKNQVQSKYCNQKSKGGISRFKKHIVGKEKRKKIDDLRGTMNISGNDDEDEVNLITSMPGTSSSKKKRRATRPMDRYINNDPASAIQARGRLKQTKLNDAELKKKRAEVNVHVARWFFQAGISMNATTLDSYQLMFEAVGQFGPGYIAPTPYELRGPLLKNEVELTKESLECHVYARERDGCSIMTDGWTDKSGRNIINLCINTYMGTTFLRSVNASNEVLDAKYILALVESGIEEVGEKNAIQVVTDNAAPNIAASKLLMIKKPKIFWTPCATHCINLMLEAISAMKKIQPIILKARALTTFIYSHHVILNMMRRRTNKKDIVREGVTRFATSFLSLQSILEHKEKLRHMFTSDEWSECRWSKNQKGKTIAASVISSRFWDGVVFALNVFQPLVKVLRMVDSDRTPVMGFLYAAMKNAKKEITENLGNDEESLTLIFEIIDAKWEKQLHRPIHAAAFYLNPLYFYDDNEIQTNHAIMSGLMEVIDRFFSGDVEALDQVANELISYRNQSGGFGNQMAMRQRKSPDLNPVQWWSMYGSHVPLLANMAKKILNLTCSSSGCERNWSTFEMNNTKRRNRLEQKVLNDLVYVQYNARFRQRREDKNMDPLCAKNMDEAKEWLNSFDAVENDEVYPDSDLALNLVNESTGASTMAEPRKSLKFVGASTSQRMEDEEPILASEDDTDEDEDGYFELDASEDEGEKSED